MTVGEKITYFRNIKHYSVNKLANLAGISQSYLRDIELLNKNPTIEILTYICDALEISLETFFSETESPDPFDDALYEKISLLTPSQKASLTQFLDTMINQRLNWLEEFLSSTQLRRSRFLFNLRGEMISERNVRKSYI